MKSLVGNIWELSVREDLIVCTVNIGWRRGGAAVMGAGLALDAARRWPDIARAWGQACQEHRKDTPPMLYKTPGSKVCKGLILFPTKPFNTGKPWLSWMDDASLELIERWLPWLNSAVTNLESELTPVSRVLVPSLGCQNGNLKEEQVLPLLEQYLANPRFIHVRRHLRKLPDKKAEAPGAAPDRSGSEGTEPR